MSEPHLLVTLQLVGLVSIYPTNRERGSF